MASFETTRPAPFGAETVYHVANFGENLWSSLVDWNNRRITRSAIAKLSDRDLADIGLTRADVESM